MPAPNDYSAAFGGADPSQSFMQGVQQSAVLQDLQMKQQQQQAAMAQQQQQQQALQSLFSNPASGAQDYARVMTAIPQLSEHLKRAWDTKNTDQQQQELSNLSQWMYAIKSGQPDVASSLMRTRAEAMERAGLKDQAQALKTKADIVDAHPEFAGGLMMALAQAHPDGKKLVDNMTAMGAEKRAQDKAPVDLRTATADATIKETQAGNAPVATALGNEKTAQEIRASQLAGDISRLDTQIKGANSETERGKLTLDREKLVMEQQKLVQGQGQQAQDAQNLSTQALTTVATIKTHPGMDGFFTAPGTKWGAVWRVAPGSDRQALEGWVDSLKGQLGYSSLLAAKAASPTGASGFGALSEGELKMLSNLAGNLDPNSGDFPRQLASVERFLQKTQNTATARPGLPNKGEAFVANVPGFGIVDEGRINRIMRENPGSTRDQVIQFLKTAGAK